MEIIIRDDATEIVMTNDGFDNDNYITIKVKDDSNEAWFDAEITELYAAVSAFYDNRKKNREMTKLL